MRSCVLPSSWIATVDSCWLKVMRASGSLTLPPSSTQPSVRPCCQKPQVTASPAFARLASTLTDDSGDWMRVTNDDDVDRSELLGRGCAGAPLVGRERKPPERPGVEPSSDVDDASDDESAPESAVGDVGGSMSDTLPDRYSDGGPDEPVGSSLVVESPSAPLSSLKPLSLWAPRPSRPPKPVPSLRDG